MSTIIKKLFRRLNITMAAVLTIIMVVGVGIAPRVYSSDISNFTQTIGVGTLSVDIVDGSYVAVGSPAMALDPVSFSFACQTATGLFGSSTPTVQKIYVKNPDAADGGWTVTLAGSATTNVWDSAGTDFDFNDAGGSGCTDDTDDDTVGGQMTVDASAATLAKGACALCDVENVSKGESTAFVEGSVNTVTILTGAAGSDDIGDWLLTDVLISQKIPAEQPAASDYDINMKLTIATS